MRRSFFKITTSQGTLVNYDHNYRSFLEHPPKWEERFCFYGTYYYAQGMYQRGGNHSEVAQKLVQEMLLPKQAGDGSWTAANGEENNHGAVYSTSMAVLSLSVKYHYLPIYQK